MNWLSSHQESESLAAAAHESLRRGDTEQALQFFRQAAAAETQALEALNADKPRTLGVTAVSAVALLYKAGELENAEQIAHRTLAMNGLPSFAIDDLRGLLQTIWNEQAQNEAGVSFVPGQVVVSVKGGDVVTGGAPLDLILEKVQIVQNFFYRTAEYLQDLPLRRKGPPSTELQEKCRPWLFQSVPGSYQFAVAIQKPRQAELFPSNRPEPKVLTDTFLSILKTAGEDANDTLMDIVPKDDYRETFLKMTRNLAPTGKLFTQMEIRAVGDRNSIVLSSDSRKLIQEKLRGSTRTKSQDVSEQEVTLQGILRALDLDHDWLEVTVEGEHKRVTKVGETVDDLIGPLVNRKVIVRGLSQQGKLIFLDIEGVE